MAYCDSPQPHAMLVLQGSSFLTISLFWRGFLATCTCTVVLHMLAFMKVWFQTPFA